MSRTNESNVEKAYTVLDCEEKGEIHMRRLSSSDIKVVPLGFRYIVDTVLVDRLQ